MPPPSSSKFHTARQPPLLSTRNSKILIVSSLIIGFTGFLFGISVILTVKNRTDDDCLNIEPPRSVRVVWGTDTNNKNSINHLDLISEDTDKPIKRHKVMAFVGIQTGFRSAGRRRSLRKTWMPSNRQGLQRLEQTTGMAIRFVIGRSTDRSKMEDLKKEITEYDDFLLIDFEEHYLKLPHKTLEFFKAAYALYDAQFYVKVDDDIYLRPDRLSLLLQLERSHSQVYLGCMKKGHVNTDPKYKWYEPMYYVLGKEYFVHAYGPIYALSADVVASLAALRNNSFRMFQNEDVTIGAWMLAMNVNHESYRELCHTECTPTSIAIWDIPECSGLCNPEKKLLELHENEMCSKSPTVMFDDE